MIVTVARTSHKTVALSSHCTELSVTVRMLKMGKVILRHCAAIFLTPLVLRAASK